MDKFNRRYELIVQLNDGSELLIQLPFTIEFEIHRSCFSSSNIASVRIYNLNEDNRNKIQHNQYDIPNQKIFLKAGYGEDLGLAFDGYISQAWSVREGTNFITQIECYDGALAYLNGITNLEVNGPPTQTSEQSVIDRVAEDLKNKSAGNVTPGAIGSYDGFLSKGNSFSGSTLQILSEIAGGSGGGVFIDNGKLNILRDNEAIETDIPEISFENGLLGTPVVENTYINIEMVFEPSLKIGQLVQLRTLTAGGNISLPAINSFSKFNGIHKVISLRHSGMISDAVCGAVITSVGLLMGTFTPVPSRS